MEEVLAEGERVVVQVPAVFGQNLRALFHTNSNPNKKLRLSKNKFMWSNKQLN